MSTHTPITYEGALSLDMLDVATKVVDTSGVVEQLAEWDSADRAGRGLGGRPAHVPVRAALILFILPALLGKPMYVRESSEILRYRLGGKAWNALDIDLRKWDTRTSTTWYDRLWRTLRYRVRDVIDPFPETPHWRRLDKEEYAELAASRDPEFVKSRHARTSIFMSMLALASAKVLNEDMFDGWDGDIAIDGTPIEVTGYGRTARSRRQPSTPEAGWYVRTGDHKGDGVSGVEHIKKSAWGFETTAVVAVGGEFGKTRPAPVIGLSLDKPGYKPGYNARAALAHLEGTNLPRRYAVTDMAYYPLSKAEHYQIPMREKGWKLVGEVPNRTEAKGVSAAYRGVTLVDGTGYCPAIAKRKDLLDPKGEFDKGNITEEQFALAIAQRKRLQLDVKEVEKDGTVRFSCPALSGKVACPLRKNDEQAKKNAAKKGAAGNPALPLPARQVPSKKTCGDLCRQQSVSIAVNDPDATRFNKYHQQGPAAYTDEWTALYKPYRARNEAANAFVKGESHIGTGDRTKKAMRGFTGVALRTVLAVVAANVRLYVNHLKRQRDNQGPTTPGPGGRPPGKKHAVDFTELAGPNAPPAPGHTAA
ncbi:hypothetical protein [Corynebacterium hadale]|uniref:hypothetical protein n=1 Tax=Corynebacterium hadale TaxID=2026255 RepID=UPI000BAA3EB0|nr:hypothetical protein [Corynebacterium hadale]PAT13525.1 hypothetical protein CKJ83_01410 [Corynebacterium hadale]